MSKTRIKPNKFKVFDINIINAIDYENLVSSQENDLKSLYEKKTAIFKVNKIVEGVILEKTNDGLKVDISYKSNGFVPAAEFDSSNYEKINVGNNLEVMIEELESKEGLISLSYEKAKTIRIWEDISNKYKENKSVEGIVTSKVKGGLYVDIGINAFLPGSQIDTQRVTDFDQWIGKKVQCYIVKIMPKRGNVIISRRKFVYEQKSEVRKGILDTLSVGQVIDGIVKNITKYGAFVDVGGVDGLLHITDMTWSRIEDPTEIMKIGDTIAVKILSFDKETEKISLGMKQLTENPWDSLPADLATGSTIKGKIISIKDYGIFIEIAKGVEGLVHISEISWTDRINDLTKHFTIGQDIEAVVVSFEKKSRRMSLSIKQLEKNPWETILDKYQIGQTITGKITNIADFGFFIQIATGVDGLVHISDISWTQHIKHPSDVYKKDDVVDAKIIDINKQKRKISLSIKALTENPWDKVAKEITPGSFVTGKVIKIADFGAFVKLQNSDIEAFIHVSECSDTPNISINEALTIGNTYTFRVLRVSAEEQKIGLSLRKEDKKTGHRPSSERNNNQKGNNNNSSRKENYNKKEASSYSSSSENSTKKKSAFQIELEKLMEQQKKG